MPKVCFVNLDDAFRLLLVNGGYGYWMLVCDGKKEIQPGSGLVPHVNQMNSSFDKCVWCATNDAMCFCTVNLFHFSLCVFVCIAMLQRHLACLEQHAWLLKMSRYLLCGEVCLQ